MEKLQLSYQHFVALARNMRDPRFPNVHPLCRFLFEKPSVEKAFLYLIYWLPKSKRADGSIYKSATELARQTGYCSRTMERVRTVLETMGFTVYVKKANGAPTNHYRLDVEKFLHYVAAKLKTSVEQVYAWMTNTRAQSKTTAGVSLLESEQPETGQMSETVSPDKSRSETRKRVGVQDSDKRGATPALKSNALTADSIGNQKHISTAQATFYDRMADRFGDKRGSGFSKKLEEEIVRIGTLVNASFEQVEGWIDTYGFHRVNNYTKYAAQKRDKVRNPRAWVQNALENDYKLDKNWRMESSGLDYCTGRYADFVIC
jgi:hypothetical protein